MTTTPATDATPQSAPRPWRIDELQLPGYPTDRRWFALVDAENQIVDAARGNPNANLIVQAVNAYDDLVKLVKDIAERTGRCNWDDDEGNFCAAQSEAERLIAKWRL